MLENCGLTDWMIIFVSFLEAINTYFKARFGLVMSDLDILR